MAIKSTSSIGPSGEAHKNRRAKAQQRREHDLPGTAAREAAQGKPGSRPKVQGVSRVASAAPFAKRNAFIKAGKWDAAEKIAPMTLKEKTVFKRFQVTK